VLIALLLPAVQMVRAAAASASCRNNQKQLALACLNYESENFAFPTGDAASSTSFANGNDEASWLFLALPYLEQNDLYVLVRNSGSLSAANTAGLLPQRLPFTRCPADGFQITDGQYCNYVGSSGPQCNNPPSSCPTAPFQQYCNGTSDPGQEDVPTAVNTYPGYGPSWSWGDTADASLVRGMFARGGAVITLASVTDGTSSTILLGETLPEFCEFQRWGNPWGWAGFNSVSQGQTIQPINYPIDPIPLSVTSYTSDCSSSTASQYCPNGPAHCLLNWHVTWGFKSHHNGGGANFAFVDGSVHFITQSIDHRIYQYLGCRNDGQVASPPQ
jgi:prepilin-type processing-associated H-X9-DG protein